MASKKKGEDYYIFDKQNKRHKSVGVSFDKATHDKIEGMLKSRYAILIILITIFCIMIFLKTAAIQLSASYSGEMVEVSGISRQIEIEAPRGDIVDASGTPIAYSESINALYISNANLDNKQLNEMLLDLANLLEAHNIPIKSELFKYFDVKDFETFKKNNDKEPIFFLTQEMKNKQLEFEFKKDKKDIKEWQMDKNYFYLSERKEGEEGAFDSKVKLQVKTFYDYLLYQKFAIESKKADGRKYSDAEAFVIMALRYEILRNNWAFQNGTKAIEIASPVGQELIDIINEQNFRYQGVIVSKKSNRKYSAEAQYLSHVIGYVGPITEKQYETMNDSGYQPNDIIGQTGVEYSAERYLKGINGIKPFNIWGAKEEKGLFFSEDYGKKVIPGYETQLTIDLSLQKTGVDSLKNTIDNIYTKQDGGAIKAKAGTVVAINAKTGAVLVEGNYPYFDPNHFVNQKNDAEAAKKVQAYLKDTVGKPLLNRAIMENFPPGSTMKPYTAMASLEEGIINLQQSVYVCHGTETIADREWKCLEKPNGGHGALTLVRALATSCNIYMFKLGYDLGIDNLSNWCQNFGLGEYTGIDLPGEVRGIRPSRELKEATRTNAHDKIWYPADTCQAAIGQQDHSYTAMQMVRAVAAVGTGEMVTPHVISNVVDVNGMMIRPEQIEKYPLNLQAEHIEMVRQGMVQVGKDSDGGTAYSYFNDFPISVACKTGTAETGKGKDDNHSLFICYAPAEDPEIAISVIIEYGGAGSNSIQVAKDILTQYFKLNETENNPND